MYGIDKCVKSILYFSCLFGTRREGTVGNRPFSCLFYRYSVFIIDDGTTIIRIYKVGQEV